MIDQILTAVQPSRLLPQYLSRQGGQLSLGPVTYHLEDGRLFLVSVGKAAVPMAQAAAAILGEALFAGICLSKRQAESGVTRLQYFSGDHPVSGPQSVQATAAILDLLAQTRPGDLVLCLISGGTSALLAQPRLPLADWQALNQALLASGCPITAFNQVRRQLDRVKGGGLARLAAPATVVSLILSDVIGRDLAAIGSGPTVFSDDTPADALAVLAQFGIEARLDTAVYQSIVHTLKEIQPEPAPGTAVTNLIVGDIRIATQAARQQAAASGWQTMLVTTHLTGEARAAGAFAAAIALDLPPGHAAILGGETTVTLRGDGRGSRNLELALAAAMRLEGEPYLVVAAFATDGDDGPTGMAGAMVSGETVVYGRELGLDATRFLDNNDSYTYFQTLDEAGFGPHLIHTGPTGTNVNDLILIFHFAGSLSALPDAIQAHSTN